ncbi:ubiquitin-conjugating enzyme E2 C-like [Lineus longissimus]|uniref:ubiquitin-conjugating enzyme E2 C-like n=1 Tax=Lineus longissimus TaxID=88925 RepID=UPI002B4EA37F
MASSQNVDPAIAATMNSQNKGQDPSRLIPKDKGNVRKRLQSDLKTMMFADPKDGVSAFPEGDNLFRWIATVSGGPDTRYANLTYKLTIDFPSGYPCVAPTVKFTTPCFHPNIDQHGNICLDILKDQWTALYDVRTVLLSIQSLLAEPNNNSPLNVVAADLWAKPSEYQKVLLNHYEKNKA